MQKIISLIMVIVGLINFFPIVGVFSATSVQNLYHIGVQSQDVAILLRHRAVLFGIVGGFMIIAAFRPDLQPSAFTMGFISMIGFLLITLMEGNPNAGIHKVFMIDLFATIGLIIALGLKLWFAQPAA